MHGIRPKAVHKAPKYAGFLGTAIVMRRAVSDGVDPLLDAGEDAVLTHAEYDLIVEMTTCSWPREGPSVGWVGPLRGQNGEPGSKSGAARSGTS
jgi:hypothetical protein